MNGVTTAEVPGPGLGVCIAARRVAVGVAVVVAPGAITSESDWPSKANASYDASRRRAAARGS